MSNQTMTRDRLTDHPHKTTQRSSGNTTTRSFDNRHRSRGRQTIRSLQQAAIKQPQRKSRRSVDTPPTQRCAVYATSWWNLKTLEHGFTYFGFAVAFYLMVASICDLAFGIPYMQASKSYDWVMLFAGGGMLWLCWDVYKDQHPQLKRKRPRR